MQAKILICLVALVAVAAGDNSGCPHPTEAKTLLLEKRVVALAPNDGRHVEHVEIPREVIYRTDISCITVVANRVGATPDYISFGKNDLGGYSIILHSRLRNALNASLYVYSL